MSKYNIFISYRRSEGWELARLVYEALREKHFKAFLDVSEKSADRYDINIQNKLSECNVYILILERNTLKEKAGNDVLKDEIFQAIALKKHIIILYDESSGFPDKKYIPDCYKDKNLELLNAIPVNPKHYASAISQMFDAIYKYKQQDGELRTNSKTYSYFAKSNPTTIASPINIANEAMDQTRHNYSIYEHEIRAANNVFARYQELNVLHINCGYGELGRTLLHNNPKLVSYLGVCASRADLKVATLFWTDEGEKVAFTQYDISDRYFINKMREVCGTNHKKYNVVIIDNTLSKLEDPASLLYQINNVMTDDGSIIIIDTDEGLRSIYPDPDGKFKEMYLYYQRNPYIHHPLIGREIPLLLPRCFEKVKLENSIKCNTWNSNNGNRVNDFSQFYGHLLWDYTMLHNEDEYDEDYYEAWNFLTKNKTLLETRYKSDNLVEFIPLVIWTAQLKKRD